MSPLTMPQYFCGWLMQLVHCSANLGLYAEKEPLTLECVEICRHLLLMLSFH